MTLQRSLQHPRAQRPTALNYIFPIWECTDSFWHNKVRRSSTCIKCVLHLLLRMLSGWISLCSQLWGWHESFFPPIGPLVQYYINAVFFFSLFSLCSQDCPFYKHTHNLGVVQCGHSHTVTSCSEVARVLTAYNSTGQLLILCISW